MFKYLLIISVFLGLSFVENRHTYRNINYGDYLAITFDKVQEDIDWDRSGNNLAFVSTNNGNRAVFYLNLSKLTISSAGNGFYSADYLNELVNKRDVYQSLFKSKDTSFFAPKWNKKGNKILSIGNIENTNEIFITNKTTKIIIGTKIKNIQAAHWKNDSIFYVSYKSNPNKLFETKLISNQKILIAETSFPILSISKQNQTLLLTSKGGVSEFSIKNKTIEWFKLPIRGKTVWRLAKLNFVGLNKNGNAQILDLNNANTFPLCFGDNNGAPAISGDKKFVAFYSESFKGIIIKRIDKKFLIE